MGTLSGFFKTHGEEVYNMSLNEIFSSGKWTSTSLNTLIIKKLCLTLLEQEKHDPYLRSIYKRIIANDDTWWSTVALEIAEKSNIKKTINPSTKPVIAAASVH
jgi:hypothetical protein